MNQMNGCYKILFSSPVYLRTIIQIESYVALFCTAYQCVLDTAHVQSYVALSRATQQSIGVCRTWCRIWCPLTSDPPSSTPAPGGHCGHSSHRSHGVAVWSPSEQHRATVSSQPGCYFVILLHQSCQLKLGPLSACLQRSSPTSKVQN